MNPYNFVRLGKGAPRKPVGFHDRFLGHSGILTCRVQLLTPLFVSQPQNRPQNPSEHQSLKFLREAEQPIVPGSSLKGVFRIVAEALSGSCLLLPNDPRMRELKNDKLSYWDKGREHEFALPPGFAPCGLRAKNEETSTQTACPACRIFGYVYRGEVLQGHVGFTAAKPVNGADLQFLTLEPYGSPSPRHKPFYGTGAPKFEQARGRKFYYHHPNGARLSHDKTGRNKTVEALMSNIELEFEVDYDNLQSAELALLVFALALEGDLRHKMGMGKGVGLGSVAVRVSKWRQIERAQRYRRLAQPPQVLEGEMLGAAIATEIANFHHHYSGWKEQLDDLKKIWTWGINQDRVLQYPSYFWFKDEANRSLPLEEVPDNAGGFGLRSEKRGTLPVRRLEPEPRPDPKSADRLKRMQKETETAFKQAASSEWVYKNRDTDHAKVTAVQDETVNVRLSKMADREFNVKKKNLYRPYGVGSKIRVRVFVDAKGEIARVEEV